jgi:hypothetical protein
MDKERPPSSRHEGRRPARLVSKVFDDHDKAIEEDRANAILDVVDPREEFSIRVKGRCRVNPTPAAAAVLRKCGKQFNFSSKLTSGRLLPPMQLLMRNGGQELLAFLRGIDDRGPRAALSMPPRAVLQSLRSIASGLCRLHAAGHVHFDIKAQNAVIDIGEANPAIRLIDFGVGSTTLVKDILTRFDRQAWPDEWSKYYIFPPDPQVARQLVRISKTTSEFFTVKGLAEIGEVGKIERARALVEVATTSIKEFLRVLDEPVKPLCEIVTGGFRAISDDTWAGISDEIRWLAEQQEPVEEVYRRDVFKLMQGIDVYCFGLLALQVIARWDQETWAVLGVFDSLVVLLRAMIRPNRHQRCSMQYAADSFDALVGGKEDG